MKNLSISDIQSSEVLSSAERKMILGGSHQGWKTCCVERGICDPQAAECESRGRCDEMVSSCTSVFLHMEDLCRCW